MTDKKKQTGSTRPCCDELADDGVDPRAWHGPRRRDDQHKTSRLCGAVRDVLAWAITWTADDPRLADAETIEVRPLADGSRLKVVAVAGGNVSSQDVQAALEASLPLLRDALATELRRRRLPDLVFDVVPDEETPS